MIVQLLVSGIAVGIVYGLIAMGMVLIFRAVGIMNFAQGDFLMFGGYFAYTFNQMLGLNIVLSLILASLCMGVIGVIFMRTSYWALRGAQAKAIIVSAMGASIVLKEGARLIWGSIPLSLDKVKEGSVTVAGATIQWQYVAIIGIALLLMLLFSVQLGWLPPSGLYGPDYYVMPVISISAVSLATFARTTRSSMLEVIRQDYIRTARAKGQTEWVVVTKHALRNALIPIITIVGVQFATALGGAVVNEQIFGIPGLGKLMVDSIKSRDFPVVQGGVLVIAIMFSFLNLFIDVLYAFVDPRIKSQYMRGGKKKKTAVAAAAAAEAEEARE